MADFHVYHHSVYQPSHPHTSDSMIPRSEMPHQITPTMESRLDYATSESQLSQEAQLDKTQLKRGPWAQREDDYLIHLVNANGPINWVRISEVLGTRTPKQCRERFHQNLKPSLNHDPISEEEGRLIEELVIKTGKRWAEIARHLNNRSDNAVKNWWNGSQNRRKRLENKRKNCTPVLTVESRSLPSQPPHFRRSVTPPGPHHHHHHYSHSYRHHPYPSASSARPTLSPLIVAPQSSYSTESPIPSPTSDRSHGSDWFSFPRSPGYITTSPGSPFSLSPYVSSNRPRTATNTSDGVAADRLAPFVPDDAHRVSLPPISTFFSHSESVSSRPSTSHSSPSLAFSHTRLSSYDRESSTPTGMPRDNRLHVSHLLG